MNTEEIIEGYMGSTEVNSIYQGSELIWPKFKYLIGGNFTSPKNKIIRLNNDGSIDNNWYDNSYASGSSVYELAYDNINKKIYAAGNTTLNGGLVRYNNDGTKDSSFNIGTGFNSQVISITYDNINKKIYVGGDFTTFAGGTQNRIMRFNNDGFKDSSFNIGTGFNIGGVYALNIDTINQKLYVGGGFTTYQGTTQNRLVRLNMNGSVDTSFNIGTGFNSQVRSIKIDNTNSKIYVGGDFTTFQGVTQNRLIRLNNDGTKDTSFNVGTGLDDFVRSIIIDNINSKIYVGGDFTTFNGTTQNKLIRLNMNGTKDTSFNIGTGFNGDVQALNIDTINKKIYVGGTFTTFQGNTQNKLIRLNMDGSKDISFNIPLNSSVETILKYIE